MFGIKDPFELIVLALMFVVCGLITSLVGWLRGNPLYLGFVLGTFFGPLGFLAVLISPVPKYSYVPMPDIQTNFIKGARWWATFNQVAYFSEYIGAVIWLLHPSVPPDYGFIPRHEYPENSRRSYDNWLRTWRMNLKHLVLLRELERQYVMDRFWMNWFWLLKTPFGWFFLAGIFIPFLSDMKHGFVGCRGLLQQLFHWPF